MFKVLLRFCYTYCGTDSDTKLLPTACQLPQFIKQHKVNCVRMWSIEAYGNYCITDETSYSDHTMAFWVKTQCRDSGRNATQMLLWYERSIRKTFPAPLFCTTNGKPLIDANLEAQCVLQRLLSREIIWIKQRHELSDKIMCQGTIS
jgi:hypothetical protein